MKAGWEVRQIEDVTFIQEGPGIRKYEYQEDGFPMINVRCVQDGYIDMSSARAANTELATGKWKHFQVDAGDILFTISGTIGRCAIVQKSDLPLLMNTSVVRFRPTVPELDSRFLYFFLQSEGFQGPLKSLSSGTAIRNVGPTHIKTLSIPVPPLEEQKQIVAVLDEAFEGLAGARAHADANLQNARELFDEAEAKLFRNISNGSTETSLGEIASFRNGLNYSRTSQGDEVKVVGVGDFQDNFIIPTETLSSTKIDGQLSEDDKLLAGDILAVRSNGNRELIGRTMLMPESGEPTSFSGFTIRIRLNCEDAMPEYVCSFLRTKTARQKLTAGGGGANISNLNQRILSSFPISYPDIDGQRDALNHLERLRENSKGLRESYAAKLQNLDDLRQSLLQKAFAGELT